MTNVPESLQSALADRYALERVLGSGGMFEVAARLQQPHILPLHDSGEAHEAVELGKQQ
jgi:hypothetical protein